MRDTELQPGPELDALVAKIVEPQLREAPSSDSAEAERAWNYYMARNPTMSPGGAYFIRFVYDHGDVPEC